MSENDQLQWTNKTHAVELAQNINIFHAHGDFTDVSIVIEGTHFLCHKLILAAASSYFYTMFTCKLSETVCKEVELHVLNKETFKDVLRYIYFGKVEIMADNVQGLLHAADMLFLEDLKHGCVEFYQRYINTDNCLGIWQFSSQCNAKILAERSLSHALKEFNNVYKTSEFLDLDGDSLIEYLSHKALCVSKEESICTALLLWLNHSPSSRSQQFMQILPQLHLQQQRPNTLRCQLLSNKHLQDNTAALDYIQALVNNMLFLEPFPDEIQLLPARDSSEHARVFVIIGGFTGGRRSKQCYTVSYDTDLETTQTVGLCEVPTVYNIEVASCVHSNVIYVSGCGEDCDELWKLDINRSQLWTQCVNLSMGKICHIMVPGAPVDNTVFILGGYNQQKDRVLGDIELYNTDTNSNSKLGSLVKPVACAMGAFYNGLIYIFGGVTTTDRPSSWIQLLTIETMQCTLLPITLPHPSCRLQAVFCHNKLIALGMKHSFVIDLKSLQANKEQKEIFQTRKGLKKDLFSAHLLGDKLFLFSGRINEDDKNLSDNINVIPVSTYLRDDDCEWENIGRLPVPLALYTSEIVYKKRTYHPIGNESLGMNQESEI